MGDGRYYRDVSPASSSSLRAFNDSGELKVKRRECHEILSPFKTRRECRNNSTNPNVTPIAIVMDVTSSRGKDIDIVISKLPRFIGRTYSEKYVTDPTISFSAVGDATAGDIAPFQVGQFEADARLDKVLTSVWPELGGGGTGQESYQLAAYYYARHTDMDIVGSGRKGYLFFLGDEGFYPEVDKDEVLKVFGDKISANIPSAQIFRELQEKFHVFLIFPRKSWEERKKDIDEEIKQRVIGAGGLYENVDIRFSLAWGNRNDLDIHCITPAGTHIFFGNKISNTCKGQQDVDMNISGETTKPVENIRWPKGKGKPGRYKVFVQNYAFHERSYGDTPFRVEIEINGEIQQFKGVCKASKTGDASNVLVGEFEFDPTKTRKELTEDNRYEGYDDSLIQAQWAKVIPRENILLVNDPKAIIDTMLGVFAIHGAGQKLEQFIELLVEDKQDQGRIADVRTALGQLAEAVNVPTVDIKAPAASRKTAVRKSKTVKI